MKYTWLFVVLCLFLSSCSFQQFEKKDTLTQFSLPNPVCDIIAAAKGRPQVTQPVPFTKKSSWTRANMPAHWRAQ